MPTVAALDRPLATYRGHRWARRRPAEQRRAGRELFAGFL